MKRDLFRLGLSITGSLVFTELIMYNFITPYIPFNGILLIHVLIFYVIFLLIFSTMNIILKIDESEVLDNEKLEEEIKAYEENKKSE